MIFSPFDEKMDPFFFGFPDTAALRHMEQLFREFMDPYGNWPGAEFFRHFDIPDPGDFFRGDSLFPHFPPPPEKKAPRPRKMKGNGKGKVINL